MRLLTVFAVVLLLPMSTPVLEPEPVTPIPHERFEVVSVEEFDGEYEMVNGDVYVGRYKVVISQLVGPSDGPTGADARQEVCTTSLFLPEVSKDWDSVAGKHYADAYVEFEVSSGCDDPVSWKHRLKEHNAYWATHGSPSNETTKPGETDYDTRTAYCDDERWEDWMNHTTLPGGTNTTRLACNT